MYTQIKYNWIILLKLFIHYYDIIKYIFDTILEKQVKSQIKISYLKTINKNKINIIQYDIVNKLNTAVDVADNYLAEKAKPTEIPESWDFSHIQGDNKREQITRYILERISMLILSNLPNFFTNYEFCLIPKPKNKKLPLRLI